MARTPYKWFNINRIGPGKRVNGKSGKAETTIFWSHYSEKCRTVGTYSPRRNHGTVTASRQTEKIHDIEEWTGCEYIQLKEMSQDRAQWRRKISEWSSAVANPHRGRSTSDWASVCQYTQIVPPDGDLTHVSRKLFSMSEPVCWYNMLLTANLALSLDQLENISLTLATLSLSPRMTDSPRIAALNNL